MIKLSEYIEKLQAIYQEHGDMPVIRVDDGCRFYAYGPEAEEPCDHIHTSWLHFEPSIIEPKAVVIR